MSGINLYSRPRSKAILLPEDIVVGDDHTTPFRDACMLGYKLRGASRDAKPSDFLLMDPEVVRNAWVDSYPSSLRCDSLDDSALDVVTKIQMRVNGGARLVDSHSTTTTDLFTKSTHVNLASPGIPGSQISLKVPERSQIEKQCAELESVAIGTHGPLPEMAKGFNVLGMPYSRMSLALGRQYGERSSKVYELEKSHPRLATRTGSKVQAFVNIAMREADPSTVTRLVADELRNLSNIEIDDSLIDLNKEFAGNRLLRIAAMGDRKYHSVACHPAEAGMVQIRLAPMHRDSYGLETIVHWQMIRSSAKALMHVNLKYDSYARVAALVDSSYMNLYLDVASGSLPAFTIATSAIPVIEYIQRNLPNIGAIRSLLSEVEVRRIEASDVFDQGGIRDVLRYALAKEEADNLRNNVNSDLEYIEHSVMPSMEFKLPPGRVAAQSALISGKIPRSSGRSQDDIGMPNLGRPLRVPRRTRDDYDAIQATHSVTLGALIRYGIALAYIDDLGDQRLLSAIAVKQWQIITGGRKGIEGLSLARKSDAVRECFCKLITPAVVRIIKELIPYSSLIDNENLKRRLLKEVGASSIRDFKQDVLLELIKDTIFSERQGDLMYTMRRTIGRLLHGGMSDTGLLFAMSNSKRKGKELKHVILEHIGLKISQWRNNYLAQLRIQDELVDSGERRDYESCVIWQQKISMLNIIRFRAVDGTVEVYVADQEYVAMLLKAYVSRYKKIALRIRDGSPWKTEGSIWNVTDHPWGYALTLDEQDNLVKAGVERTVEFLKNLNDTYWVIGVDSMIENLSSMTTLIISNLRTAIETSISEQDQFDTRLYDDAELPEEMELKVNSNFVFSLQDPPSKRDKSIAAAMGYSKVKPPAPTQASAKPKMSGKDIMSVMGLGFGFGSMKSIAPVSNTKWYAGILVCDVLEDFDTRTINSVCTWLSVKSGYEIMPSSKVSIVSATCRLKCDSVEDLKALWLEQAEEARTKKLAAVLETDKDDLNQY